MMSPQEAQHCMEMIARGGPCLGCGAKWKDDPHNHNTRTMQHRNDCRYTAALKEYDL